MRGSHTLEEPVICPEALDSTHRVYCGEQVVPSKIGRFSLTLIR